MIDIKIEGKLPQLNTDLSPAMSKIADRMLWTFSKAHENEGYGTWSPTREGKPATLSGIRKTERTSFGSDFAEIRWKNTNHQFGGLMDVTEKMKGFFWAKWYDTGDDKWKWMALSKFGKMVFKARPMTVQKEDVDYFKEILIDKIFNVQGSQGKSNWSIN
jgi:hypothetical protein